MMTYCRPITRRPLSTNVLDSTVGPAGCVGVDVPWRTIDASLGRLGAGCAETPPGPMPTPLFVLPLLPFAVVLELRPTSITPRSIGPAATSSVDCDASAADGPRPNWRPVT